MKISNHATNPEEALRHKEGKMKIKYFVTCTEACKLVRFDFFYRSEN